MISSCISGVRLTKNSLKPATRTTRSRNCCGSFCAARKRVAVHDVDLQFLSAVLEIDVQQGPELVALDVVGDHARLEADVDLVGALPTLRVASSLQTELSVAVGPPRSQPAETATELATGVPARRPSGVAGVARPIVTALLRTTWQLPNLLPSRGSRQISFIGSSRSRSTSRMMSSTRGSSLPCFGAASNFARSRSWP